MKIESKPTALRAIWLIALASMAFFAINTNAAGNTVQPGLPIEGVIPRPAEFKKLDEKQSATLDTSRLLVRAPQNLYSAAQTLAGYFEKKVRVEAGSCPAAGSPGVICFYETKNADLGDEGYLLDVDAAGIRIQAPSAAGAFYAAQTLRQLLPQRGGRVAAGQAIRLEGAQIRDVPRFQWRGLMLDLSAHFIEPATVRQVIDNMAAYKFNRLHVHLTDNFWRVEIDAYPKLAQVGGRGSETDRNGPTRFLSKRAVADLVRYAGERNIMVVPEVDMPGHSGGAARAYPQHFDGALTYNPASAAAYGFIDRIVGELAEMFPGPYFHMGGDEVRNTNWAKMPDVLAMAKRLGGSGLGDEADMHLVEAEFTRRVADLIRKHKKVPMGWDEVGSAGLTPDVIVQWWRKDKPWSLRDALGKGHQVVVSPADRMYLDYASGPGEPGAPWEGNDGGPMSVEKIVDWEPVPADLTKEAQSKVLGVEATVWTGFIKSKSFLEFMIYPRLAAVAEVAWRKEKDRSGSTFQTALQPHIERWKALGINVRSKPEDAYRYMTH